jgi:serine/threonine protein kinase/tetratricopeptide (TPR) repeat protein
MHADASEVRAIFLAAVEKHAPEHWPAYLDAACAGQPALRRRVEALLQGHALANSLLDVPEGGLAGTTAEPLTERPGTVIGPYKLLEQIGEGGFGVVFLAEQQQPLRRKVALKVIKPGMDTKQVIARFEAERQALALMDHPNIARVLDAGATATGRPFFVMELVKGVPLTQFCDDRRLTTRQRLELVVHVCQAVQHAHHKGVIHRDLKPTNVLVTLHDGTPVPKVIDFGIAKAVGQQLTDKTLVTGFAQMIGTPLYMSPEQAGLSGLDVDTRSDVYALGVLLYELLTGTTPFEKERLRQAAYDEVLRIIREEEAPKPSTRISTLGQAAPTVAEQRQVDPKRLSRLLRGELDWIVLKALEKDRTRRYATAQELADDLRRYLDDKAILAKRPTLGRQLARWSRRHKGAVLAAGLVLLALLGGIAVSTWQAVRATEAEGQAKAALAEARQAGRQTLEALRTLTDEVLGRQLARQTQLTAEDRALLHKALGHYEGFAATKGDGPESRAIRAEGYFRVGNIRTHLGELQEARAAYTEALALRQQLAADFPAEPDYRKDLASTHNNLGILLARLGERGEAVTAYRQALALREQLPADFPNVPQYRWNLAASHINLGGELNNLGNHAEAEAEYRQALTLLKQLADNFPAVAEYRNGLAGHLYNLGLLLRDQRKRPDDAAAEFRQALALQKQLTADFPTVPHFRAELANGHMALGKALKELGQATAALDELRQALTLQNQLAADFPIVPDYRQSLASSHQNMGGQLAELGEGAEAEAEYRQAIAVSQRLVADFPPVPDYRKSLALSYNNLGVLLRSLGKPVEAEAEYRQSLALQKQLAADFPSVPDYRKDLAGSHNNLGNLLADLGKSAEAEAEYRQAIAVSKQLVADFPTVPRYCEFLANHHGNLGRLLLNLGKGAEAEAELRQALALKKQLVADFPTVPEYRHGLVGNHNGLGNVLRNLGKRAEAEAEYRQALALQKQLATDFPTVPSYQFDLGCCYFNLGQLVLESGQPADALPWYAQAIEVLAPVVERKPRLVTARQFLLESLQGRAKSLVQLDRIADADRDWDRALELAAGSKRAQVRLERACMMARVEPVKAVAEADAVLQGSPSSPVLFYDAACVYALSSARIQEAALSDQYAARAIALLRQAREKGYFNASAQAEHVKKDADLDSLRGRADFQKLLAEIAASKK